MKQLKDILFGVSIEQTYGSIDKQISALVYDSREVVSDTLFVAIKGDAVDGHEYIEAAIKQGATVVLVEDEGVYDTSEITYIRVNDTRIALAVMAANYYDHPSRK
ncbi:MAG: UDP-N-acetylmuramoyl-L-alanyl-D-glutamate--2,6-diaminopimelate ligase, partial [Candidatus Arcticimaribacter sp.]